MSSRKLPNLIRAFRQRSYLSQDEVAFLLGCQSGTNVCRCERFTREPSLKTLLTYQMIFQVDSRILFPGVYEIVKKQTLKRIESLIQKLSGRPLNNLVIKKLEVLKDIHSSNVEFNQKV